MSHLATQAGNPYAGWNPHVTHAPDTLCIKARGDQISSEWAEVTCPQCASYMPASLRPKNTDTVLTHVDGVPYSLAPTPRRWHRCKAQTAGTVTRPDEQAHAVEVCPCGGLRVDGSRWSGRNSR